MVPNANDTDRALHILATALRLVELWGGKTPYVMGNDSYTTGMDCSAFINRCANRRKFDGKKWWNTAAIYDDAIGPQTKWKQIDSPVVGGVGIYPPSVVNGSSHAGHIWCVEDVAKAQTIECCKSGGGICRKVRKSWFVKDAHTNGKKIIWIVAVGD